MPAAASRQMPTGVLWRALGALAWATLIRSSNGRTAHADEAPGGPLDGISYLVASTLDSGVSVGTDVVPAVTESVAGALQDSPVSLLSAPLPDAVTDGTDGTASGTQVVAPVAVPVDVTGNAIAALGDSAVVGSRKSGEPPIRKDRRLSGRLLRLTWLRRPEG
ncbi:chaplin family protein [Microbacterium sp. A204]|uniref:chaplin family protein n=1 Tax=Microbacterium sp. A204 TaxID=3457321 RepID=UPI003FD416F7